MSSVSIEAQQSVIAGAQLTVCSQCAHSFPLYDVLHFHDHAVCTYCKPVFFQRLKEGLPVTGTLDFASGAMRALAKIIDWSLLSVLQIPVASVLETFSVEGDRGLSVLVPMLGLLGVTTMLQLAYHTGFVGRFGATPGKLALRMAVVTPEGHSVGYARAFARACAEHLSMWLCGLGYLTAFFDPERRALHDHVCATRVIRIRSTRRAR